ncbi:MAG: TIGR03905 family TSCPD domain-containing protein [Turicibacter sp.]|nr:TIGR03905 family TSCPD domain-containing protein [Turicibacter sp.]
MVITFHPEGVCASEIQIEVEDGIVQKVKFIGGCPGSAQGIAQLVEGMEVGEVINRLQGIPCRHRETSCPDQLAKALKQQ